jgi:hypothetical protein
MKFDSKLKVYGDRNYRGDCPTETAEMVTFFGWLRKAHPESYGKVALHIRNEGQRTYRQTARQKSEGMVAGAADIVIPGNPTFVCEMKRLDHTRSSWQKGQREYLAAASDCGAFVCVALGWEAARQAVEEWLQ